MSIISKIGTRSLKVRLTYGTIFFILSFGAVTMIYPLLQMVSGSVRSQADAWEITPWPKYWFNDLVLYQKFLESKYNTWNSVPIEQAWHKPVGRLDLIKAPAPVDPQILEQFPQSSHKSVNSTLQPGLL